MENYKQIRVLGKGSFGSAWLIQRNVDKVQFVAKEIRLAGLQPVERDSAKNEIEVLRKLNHPNITRYIDHFEHKGSLFIVMEYANGGDLYVKIKERQGRLFSEKELLHYFSQICLALGYLHEQRILHRDLKTQNVFLTKDGIVKLGDFGISTVLRNTYELKRTVCGTPYYFSPELCLSKPYNNKSDVWALGCILYEMTTLNHAFDGRNMKALVQKILKVEYPPINAAYSGNLSKLISAMLQIDPQRRPNVSQIIELSFIRDALTNLQREVQAAKERRQSVVPDDVRRGMQENALRRREEYQRREQQNAARLAEVHQQQRAMQEQQQRDGDAQRHRRLQEKQAALQRQQEAQLEARRREVENRVREQRRAQEARQGRIDAAEQQRREEEWDNNMRAQAEENRRREEQAVQRRAAQQLLLQKQQADAAEAYHQRQREAALNKQRAMADMGIDRGGPRGRAARQAQGGDAKRAQALNLPPDQPPPPRAPPSPHRYSGRRFSQKELGDALAAAYWQMRHEAERNKRRALGLDTGGDNSDGSQERAAEPEAPRTPTPSPPAPQQPQPRANAKEDLGTSIGDVDGEEGFREFLNCEAVIEADDAHDEQKRERDYGALDTVISQALTVHPGAANGTSNADFDDEAFAADELDPTKFMLDGKTFQLPNVSATDPLMHRIESLRMFLEEKMGDDALIECYRTLNSISTDNDERVEKVTEALPADKRRFIPLVMQLIVCEDAFNRQGMVK